MSSYLVGVDIGGTFTDCVLIDETGTISTAKTLSTHATTPTDGVMDGIALLAAERACTVQELLSQTERFNHGTTIGTNLVVERKGANVALIATQGHGDSFLMMRAAGRTAGLTADRVFDAHHETMPVPLVPRHRIIEVSERTTWDGEILAPLDQDQARRAISEVLAQGDIDAVAISLLWSVVNPAHEQALRRIVEELAPGMYVSLSSEISPRQGEFERTVATVINSYVGPASQRYLGDLSDRLAAEGLKTPLYVMQASGGVMPVDEAGTRPVQTIGSGPAGGLAGTAAVARGLDQSHVIATDMGGTSFEVGLIVDGQPTLSSQEVLDKYTFYGTHLDLRSIACGGGSIAHTDDTSSGLQVGPESAGANPGPACYGSGSEPTVTDADLVLGLLDADAFLGGQMQLDLEAAREAVGSLAERLGLSLERAAAGIVQVNANAAAVLIRQRTIEQGLDPRDFTLYAYGGAGPLHAFAYAPELGVKEVIVPLGNGASTLSAYGAAMSDVTRSFERPVAFASPYDPDALGETVRELEGLARGAMAASGISGDEVVIERSASMRYAAQQLQELNVRLPDGQVDEAFCAEVEQRFTSEYARLYSEAALALFQSVEIFNIRVSAKLPSRAQQIKPRNATPDRTPSPSRHRDVYWPGHGSQSTGVYSEPLEVGDCVNGPALVVLPHTTVAVAPGQRLSTDTQDTLRLMV